MNDKFYSLPKDKQLKIINGALAVFGKYDYKKASMEEIAKAAGISKALVFHYFGTKKELFIFLYNYGVLVIREKLIEANLNHETDFFIMMKQSIIKKAEVLQEHPALTDFIIHAYYETNAEVIDEITQINQELIANSYPTYFNNIDKSKFKDDISLDMAINTVTWLSDGYMNSKKNNILDAATLVNEFEQYLDMLRKLFYKEDI